MNQRFKFDFERSKDEPNKEKEVKDLENEVFVSNGVVRNLCFVWPDGRKKFLNYAYLVSCEYSPVDSSITLVFTSESVIIKGSGLEILFDQLLNHLPKQIICIDKRYNVIDENDNFIINDIQVVST